MKVSWNWLKDYVDLPGDPDEVAHRLAMSGLNHEESAQIGDDLMMDLEVTSNRPDCLGHLGIAREIAVLFDLPLKIPTPEPSSSAPSAADTTQVQIDCPALCPRYTARIIRGVKVGESPAWLRQRLATIGVASVNNIVDVTNYVMMECRQPLHAFDFGLLKGGRVVVREAKQGEQFVAIDHKTYSLSPGMCMICDAERAVAIGGVMGGSESEVSDATTDVLLEAADFDPVSTRNTARALNLHSPSSHRFERGVDTAGIDWASRRCCELIVQLAGGKLAAGIVDVVAAEYPPRQPVTLRFSQLPRVLGIDVPTDEARRILSALGNEQQSASADEVVVMPPSWRHDLTREVDLVEEVARIYGYDKIPEDAGVAMVPSARSDIERVVWQLRSAAAGLGFHEAMTASVVREDWSSAFSPWTKAAPLLSDTPMLRGADRLRRSLVPSLLGARRHNETLQNSGVDLFEMARVYLPQASGAPEELLMMTLVTDRPLLELKGAIACLVGRLNPAAVVATADESLELCDPARSCRLEVDGKTLGYLGELSPAGQKQFDLRSPTTIAELRVEVLHQLAVLIPQCRELSQFPSIRRDLNLVMDEAVRWSDLAHTVRTAAGPQLVDLEFNEVFRDPNKDGPDKKRLLFSFQLQSSDRTLTREEADAVAEQIVEQCQAEHQAQLLA